jgi:PAS domain-containing protein
LQLVVENARDYVILSLDLERHMTSWSSGAQTILGYTREDLVVEDHQHARLLMLYLQQSAIRCCPLER